MAIITLAKAKTFLQISDTTKDTLITALIPQIEADYLLIRNAAFDVDDDDATVYPDGSELTAAQMIGFNMSSSIANGGGFKSESIGSYSYTMNEARSIGYPDNIVKRITRFIGSKP